ncbi:MAG TPA: kelch repeat-containing protein, partial [Polyangiaceae bacterium]
MQHWPLDARWMGVALLGLAAIGYPRPCLADSDPIRPLSESKFREVHCEHLGESIERVDFCLHGSSMSVQEPSGESVTHGEGPEGSELVVVRTPEWVEDFVRFEHRPTREGLAYEVRIPSGWKAIQRDNILQFEDTIGRPRFNVTRPWLVDSSGTKYFAKLSIDCSGTANHRCLMQVDWSSLSLEYPIIVDPEWQNALKNICTRRHFHTASLIGSDSAFAAGQVLIVGGMGDDGQPIADVELFDPITKTERRCAALTHPRAYHTATWVKAPGTSRGMILVVGGYTTCSGGTCESGDVMPTLNTYELYDPSENCYSPSEPDCGCECQVGVNPNLSVSLPDGLSRAEHTATVLGNDLDSGTGRVLIVGGTAEPTSRALLYDPEYKLLVTDMTIPPRFGHTATFVNPSSGASGPIVFVVGGSSAQLSSASPVTTDLIIKPNVGSVRIVDHGDASDITQQLRPARTHCAS